MFNSIEHIEKIYRENKQIQKEYVNVIFEWLKNQPHLPELTELQIILFLHSCYYKIEETKTTIINFYTQKTDTSIFESVDEETIRNTLSKILVLISDKRTPEGYSVMFFKLLDVRPEGYDCLNHMKLFAMLLILHSFQCGPANGLLAVCDMENAVFGHLLRLNISAVRQMLYFLQEAAPIRLKGIHFINVAPVTRNLIMLIRPFLKKEIYEGIRLHTGGTESLFEYIPKNLVPKAYGGDNSFSIEELNERNIENAVAHMDFFRWHDSQKIDYSKCVPKKGGMFRWLF